MQCFVVSSCHDPHSECLARALQPFFLLEGPEAAKERTSAEELGDRSSEAKSRTEGELGEKQEERAADADTGGESSSASTSPSPSNPIRGTGAQRRAVRKLLRQLYEKAWGESEMAWNSTRRTLCRPGDAAPTDKIKLLDADTRERLADSLFNQAYSTVMSVGTFSPREHVENTLDALIGDPLKASELWRACKIRWHERLGIDVQSIRALLGETPPREDHRPATRGTASTATPQHSPPGGAGGDTTRPEPDLSSRRKLTGIAEKMRI